MEHYESVENANSPLTRPRKVLSYFCNVILSIYIAMIITMIGFANIMPGLMVFVICGLLLLISIYQLTDLSLSKFKNIMISGNAERGKLSLKIFVPVSLIMFIILMLGLLAHYPGGISPDNISQWEQAQSGIYTNWHPAIHSMIIWLITRISVSYAFFIGVQVLIFSLLSGYMAATLAAWGIKKGWIIATVVVLAAIRTNAGMLLFAWNDTTFSILLLCLAAFMINILLSDGKWLSKYGNAAAFAVVIALCSIVKHTGFFFTIPLAVLILIFFSKKTKNAVLAVIAAILIVSCVRFLIYPAAKVQYVPSQTYVESVGLPMTILGGVMVNNPQALDAETNEFLNRIADYPTWAATYQSGNFNSIKYAIPTTDVILSVSPGKLISMTLRTIANAPREALFEVIALTRIAWSPLDWDQSIEIYIEEEAKGSIVSENEILGMRHAKPAIDSLYKNIRAVIELLTPSRILTSTGLHILLLMLAGVYSANRNFGGKALLLVVPSIIYNLGTMLLLFGPEYRFFHFNVIISLPFIIALLVKPALRSEEPPESSDTEFSDTPADTESSDTPADTEIADAIADAEMKNA